MTCPTGCGRAVQPGHLMCRTCWFKVPAILRRDVWHYWRKRVRTGTAEAIAQHQAACDAAIAAVEEAK